MAYSLSIETNRPRKAAVWIIRKTVQEPRASSPKRAPTRSVTEPWGKMFAPTPCSPNPQQVRQRCAPI